MVIVGKYANKISIFLSILFREIKSRKSPTCLKGIKNLSNKK